MKRSFWSLIAVQVQVLLNDNAAKLMLMALAAEVAPELFPGSADADAKMIKTILAAIIILPFVLLSPTAGWISDRFSKRNVIVVSLWVQFAVMALVAASLSAHLLSGAVFGLFLLGTQCAIFSPAKQGIIKEIVSETKISSAVGVVEVTAIASMLVGGLSGGALYDLCRHLLGTPWHAAQGAMVAFTLLSLLSLIAGYQIKRTPAHTNEPFRPVLLWQHFGQLRDVWRERPIRLSILGISYFYGLAGALYLTLFEIAGSVHGNGPGTASQTGIYAATLGLGIVLGSFLVTRLTTHQVEIGLVPLGAGGLIAGAVTAGLSQPQSLVFLAALFGMGLAGALFVVPLNAHLQEQVEPDRRGRVLSANNLFVNLFGIAAVILQYVLSGKLGISPRGQLLLYAIPTALLTAYAVAATPDGLLRLFLGVAGRTVYRVKAVGLDLLPPTGGVLLVPNQISYFDAVILQLACPRPIRFLVHEEMFRRPLLRTGLRLLGAIPISPRRARPGIEAAVTALARGEVVCLFPESGAMRTATLQKLNRGYEWIARKMRAPVMPVWVENVWGGAFASAAGARRPAWPRLLPRRVSIHFGDPLPGLEATPEQVRRRLYDLSEQALRDRSELASHIGYEALRRLRRRYFQPVVVDTYANRILTGGTLLAAALTLSRWLKENVAEPRVGIVLPPGAGAFVANLAATLAGKTPVNLNFTAGRAANQAAIAQAGLRQVITAQAVVAQLPADFPWPDIIDLAELMKQLPPADLKRWGLLALVAPAFLLRRWIGLPREGGDAEAGLLFTSGSATEPKGVVLSHRNILANTAQIGAMLAQNRIESLLGSLPIFHSFGFTVTFWWPVLGGPRAVTSPSPLDTQRLIDTIEQHRVELMITTPTFLRAYTRKGRAGQLRSLKLVVTGAEKLPLEVLREFEAKFDLKVCEGYGMTEASPVVSTNLPDDPPGRLRAEAMLKRRIGSTGRMVPGLSARITHPETGEELPLFASGLLWLRGANVFGGYLGDAERSAEVLRGGWYCTGDVGRLDEDGFLYIEGRISRFSKLGGEMVSHLAVEQKIAAALEVPPGLEAPPVVVVGLPDEKRGESLVALTTLDLDPAELRRRLAQQGLPNLWIPKIVRRVAALPLLATGKLDLRACQRLAREAAVLSPA